MTKYRVTTRNGDILFYSPTRENSRAFASGNVVTFVGSPMQHEELKTHLFRHSATWLARGLALEEEGKVSYELPSYFVVTAVPDGDTENDAAVNNWVNPAITTPAFPAPNVADPYTAIIDVNYAFKGERFRTEETRGGKKYIRYGTFAMDGNAISPEHGWLKAEADGNDSVYQAKLKAHGPLSGKQYINVHYDDQPEGYYRDAVRADTRRGIEYVPSGKGWPNEGLQPDTAGLKIYGLPEVAARKNKTIAEAQKLRKVRTAEERYARARDEFREAELALSKVHAEK